jgi:hypothetical protein
MQRIDCPGIGNDLSVCENDSNDWWEALRFRGFKATSMHDKDVTKSNIIGPIQTFMAPGVNTPIQANGTISVKV